MPHVLTRQLIKTAPSNLGHLFCREASLSRTQLWALQNLGYADRQNSSRADRLGNALPRNLSTTSGTAHALAPRGCRFLLSLARMVA